MSTQSPLATIEQYLPATLQPSALTDRIEQRLKAPYRRTYEIWLPDA